MQRQKKGHIPKGKCQRDEVYNKKWSKATPARYNVITA